MLWHAVRRRTRPLEGPAGSAPFHISAGVAVRVTARVRGPTSVVGAGFRSPGRLAFVCMYLYSLSLYVCTCMKMYGQHMYVCTELERKASGKPKKLKKSKGCQYNKAKPSRITKKTKKTKDFKDKGPIYFYIYILTRKFQVFVKKLHFLTKIRKSRDNMVYWQPGVAQIFGFFGFFGYFQWFCYLEVGSL